MEHSTSEFGERIAAAYDRIAADFAAINAEMPAGLIAMGGRFLERLGPRGRVLDVGCGAGRDMAWMEDQGVEVTGVDLSEEMLAQARRIVRGPLLRMDMCNLALQDGQFDGVWCCASLLHLPKARAPIAVAEVRRVLVPGGAIFLSVQEGAGEGWECAAGSKVERFFARYCLDELDALLATAGFTIHQHRRDEARGCRWLNILATAPSIGSTMTAS